MPQKWYKSLMLCSWPQEVSWTYITNLKVLDIFWTPYIRLIYVHCPGGWGKWDNSNIYHKLHFLQQILELSHFSQRPMDTARKSNVHKTFRTRLGRLLNVASTFKLYNIFKGFTLTRRILWTFLRGPHNMCLGIAKHETFITFFESFQSEKKKWTQTRSSHPQVFY